jgi:BirA family biotin operon repressor/biotin-[acetyl-CoA-carboxylase] ligase
MNERDLLARLATGPASGAELAREAGQTRAAVWKHIEALRAAGVGLGAFAAVAAGAVHARFAGARARRGCC